MSAFVSINTTLRLQPARVHTVILGIGVGMDTALQSLNKAQREAVLSNASVLQVLAPPGSGKTKTLTARVAHLIDTGLPPWSIIVCTFTVKAAREMQSRIRSLVDDSSHIKIGTFHGIALRYLRKHRDLLGLSKSFGVADTSDSTAILRRIVKHNGSTVDAAATRSRISGIKAKGIDCEMFAQGEGKQPSQANFLRLFRGYQAELQRAGLLDYDDILLRCVDLLRAHPECVDSIQTVLVDEFQDTNNVQYELMSLFAQKCQRITIVGDPDQSIYGWRSAEIKNLHRMRVRWNETVTINLEENYRSSGSILMAAQTVIEQDQNRPQKALQATLSYGHRPVMRRLPGAREEATWLVDEIKRLEGLSGGLLTHNDFAILLRTASLSRIIETSLGSSGIPYRMVGGTRFYDRVEVKIVLDYLRVVDNPSHNEALARILNVPPRRIGDKTLETIQADAQRKGVTMWSLVQGLACGRAIASTNISQLAMKGLEQFTNVIMSCRKRLLDSDAAVTDVIGIALQKIGLQAYLRGKYTEDFEARWASIEDLVAQASEKSTEPQGTDESVPSMDTSVALSDFLANAALAASVDSADDGECAPVVTISTMHAAKGLEWPVVFVPACYNGSLPHSRSEDHDEERRLLYVAMTRAQAMLYLSCPLHDTQRQETSLSIFVDRPDCVKMFEELGPKISLPDVRQLATVLRRTCPDTAAIRLSSAELSRDLDDFWPVDGSSPSHEQQWQASNSVCNSVCPSASTKRAVACTGFASAKSQLESLKQQEHKTPQVHEARVGAKASAKQVDGSNKKISTFFFARSTSQIPTTIQQCSATSTTIGGNALTDVTRRHQNSTVPEHTDRALAPNRTVRHEPLHKRQKTVETETITIHDPYSMLLSSPLAGSDENDPKTSDAKPEAPIAEFRAASTTHMTSYRAATTARKTLGVKRSMNGWAQRSQPAAKRINDASATTGTTMKR